MFLYLVFSVTVSVCLAADDAVTPPIICGEVPNALTSCLGYPKILEPKGHPFSCVAIDECGKINCVFTLNGWLKDGKVEKQKLLAHYDQFASEHPAWASAVQHAKTACLAFDLPAQGTHLNCPTYDIMHCSLSSFIKNAQPSQWSTGANCEYMRQFAAVCPICPSDCFSPLVPYGSCNACLALPRSS